MFTIRILDTNHEFYCDSKNNLLQAIGLTTKKGIPVGCRKGGCGICKIQVKEGNYETLKMSSSHISEHEILENIVLACRVKPCSDLTVEIKGLNLKK
jgi:Na+-transporting NADH:ubiquinone oxidoreductase subunit NqrF